MSQREGRRPVWRPDLGVRLDRRVVLKAAASLSAMSAIGATRSASRPAVAQEDSGTSDTRAATWSEADGLTGSSLPGVDDAVLTAEFPFYAIAPHWDAAIGYWPHIEMSFSPDGLNWSEAIVAAASDHDAGRPDREGRAFGSLVLPGWNQYVRYRALDEAGNTAQVPGLAFTYIDASAGPSIQDVAVGAQAGSVVPPPIISRNAWGANESYRYEDGMEAWPPEYEAVEHVIVHHTETPNFEDPLVAVRSIYYYHAVTRGWGDIGYNYLVDFMGNVYEGRYGGENVIGGHAYQYAIGSSGIGTMGKFGDQAPTPEMTAGLTWITAWLTRDLDPYGVSDFHETPSLPTICGHRDVNVTDCPGDLLYADLQEIRNYVSAVLYEGTTPGPASGEFFPGDAVEVVVEDANLRGFPGTGAWLAATLPLGTVLRVTDGPTTTDGSRWYQVAGAPGTGWCASFVLQLTDKTPPPPPGPFVVGDTVVVATDVLKLRDVPRLSGGVLAVLPTGVEATVVAGPEPADGYLWYQLDGDYGLGWSVSEFLATPGSPLPPPPDAAFAAGDTVAVDTDALNLRSAPGLTASVVAVLPTGATGTVTAGPEWVDDYAWYQLETALASGWSVADFLVGTDAGPGASDEFAVGDHVVVATGALNLRDAPSTVAGVVAVLPTGAGLTVTGGPTASDGFTWYAVSHSALGEGWSAGQFLAASDGGAFVSGQLVRVVDGTLNLRSEPSVSAPALAALPDGTELTIQYGPSEHDGYDWWYVDGPYGTGWCVGTYLVAT